MSSWPAVRHFIQCIPPCPLIISTKSLFFIITFLRKTLKNYLIFLWICVIITNEGDVLLKEEQSWTTYQTDSPLILKGSILSIPMRLLCFFMSLISFQYLLWTSLFLSLCIYSVHVCVYLSLPWGVWWWLSALCLLSPLELCFPSTSDNQVCQRRWDFC